MVDVKRTECQSQSFVLDKSECNEDMDTFVSYADVLNSYKPKTMSN